MRGCLVEQHPTGPDIRDRITGRAIGKSDLAEHHALAGFDDFAMSDGNSAHSILFTKVSPTAAITGLKHRSCSTIDIDVGGETSANGECDE